MSLEAAKDKINKEYGKGTIMSFGADPEAAPVIPTGIFSFDKALGGGLAKGKVIEMFGPEGVGKTTLVYQIIAAVQEMGGTCAFIDVEHAMDPSYAQALGVDMNALLVSQPDYGEQAWDVADNLALSREVAFVALDSVAALCPKTELEGAMADQTVGLMARINGRALRKIKGTLNQTGTTLLLVNQIREKVGVFFGSPETTPGGRAVRHFPSQRIDMRIASKIEYQGNRIGSKIKVNVVKNKIAPPYRKCEFEIIFGEGVSKEACLLDAALEAGIVAKAGAFLTISGEQVQGREAAKTFLADNKHSQALWKELDDLTT